MGQPRLPESERRSGSGRHVNDAAANEWSTIDDCNDGASAVVEIDNTHRGSDREIAVRRK